MLMTLSKFPSFARSASTKCAPNKNSARRRNDPRRLARVALSQEELAEWLEGHPEGLSQWFAKEDVLQ